MKKSHVAILALLGLGAVALFLKGGFALSDGAYQPIMSGGPGGVCLPPYDAGEAPNQPGGGPGTIMAPPPGSGLPTHVSPFAPSNEAI